MSTEQIEVFVVDDQEITLRGIVDLMEEQPDLTVVGTALTTADARLKLRGRSPDVVITDSALPDGSGVDLCRDLRSQDPSIGVLLLTSDEHNELVFSAITAGVAGYLMRTVHAADLVDAVRRVAAGQSLLDPVVTAAVMDRLRRPDPTDQLTVQERRILTHIGEGLTNRQIAVQMNLSEKTVKNYASSIFTKIHVERRTQAALWAAAHQEQLRA